MASRVAQSLTPRGRTRRASGRDAFARPHHVAVTMWVMSELEPRRGGGMTRREREQRAYRLVIAGGTAGIVAVVSALLAAIDVIGTSLPVLAAIVAIICYVMLRRTLRG